MKFTTSSTLAALGLASNAAAQWSSHPFAHPVCETTSTVLVTATTTETVTAGATGGSWDPKGAVTVTVTETTTISALGGAGGWGGVGSGSAVGGSTSTPGSGGSGGSWGAGGSSSVSAVGGSGSGGSGGSGGSWGAGGSSSASAVDGSGSGGSGNGGSWGAGGSGSAGSTGTVGGSGSGGEGSGGYTGPRGPWGQGGSVTATITSVPYIITTPTIGSATTHAAPTYTAGSNTTNATTGNSGSSCNSASDRQSWCGGFDINTDTTTTWPTTGKTCEYHLTITNSTCNFDGTNRLCLAISNDGGEATVPGPTIECNWGDEVKIYVTNSMTENGTAIHWHGIRQLGTNPNDGVPGVTECALAPGQTRLYQWQATQYGSSWYHSHYLTQYGDGIRGPIIIHGPASANYDVDMGTVMVDDLFNLTAAQMNSLISHNGAMNAHNYLLNGKNTSPDLSTGQHAQWTVESGKKYLFRIVNSASQNSWMMHFDDHTMTVIAADFVPIVPYTTDWLAIGTGQRYDVILTADQPVSNYFFRAVTQLACPSGTDNTGLGAANGIISYAGGNTTQLPTSTYGNVTLGTFAVCEDEPIASLVPWVVKDAGNLTAFTADATTLPAGNVTLVATSDEGNVFRWFLNGNGFIDVNWTQPTLESLAENNNSAVISNAIFLPQTSVQWVYFVIQNVLGAAHPMHLHGHDFSLLGQGAGNFDSTLFNTLNFDNPPRRDTAMLVGSGYTVIGFETDNPGAWLMHCHIVWHVDGGLAMQFIERQDKIPAAQWTQTAAFQDQCDAYEAFNAKGLGIKFSGESGLKKRWFDSEEVESSVVRRSERSEKRYLGHAAARGLGDGYKPRHARR